MVEQQAGPGNAEEVLARYGELLRERRAAYAAVLGRQRRLLWGLGGVVVLIAVETSRALHGGHAVWPLLTGFGLAVTVIVLLVRLQDPVSRAQRLVSWYEGNLRRAEGLEPDGPLTGEDALPLDVTSLDAQPRAHLYEHDLDVTGVRSLFSRLSTVRTGIGERGLARYLLEPATHAESVARQDAVRELLPRTELRERIALLGASSFQQLSAGFFDRWLEEEAPVVHPAYRWALLLTTAGVLGLLLAGILKVVSWPETLRHLLLVLAVQSVLALMLRKRLKPLLEGGARLQGQVRLFAEGVALLGSLEVKSARLQELQRLSREPAGAVRLLKQLDGSLMIVEQRTREYFFLLSLLTAAGSQAAMSIARWKRRHVPAMRVWMEAWGEFEALNALATYAFEHPADGVHHCWPELLGPGTPPTFVGEGVGHPLLPKGIRNEIRFDGEHRLLLISGSNMAGKSTLMRSIGCNALLAYAGAPVRASSLRLTTLTIGASIALTDSLAEGKSKFMAEVERLSAIVSASATQPVLFLVDEIFSGTNSLDRRTAAAAVLERLLGHGAIGALSTHDLTLTTLATEANAGRNVHMASPDPEDPLAFDYRLKPGVNESSNAMAILRMMGLV